MELPDELTEIAEFLKDLLYVQIKKSGSAISISTERFWVLLGNCRMIVIQNLHYNRVFLIVKSEGAYLLLDEPISPAPWKHNTRLKFAESAMFADPQFETKLRNMIEDIL